MIVRPADWIAQPWQNGGGITHKIARWPAGADDFEVRASLAEVSRSGPFSRFPGYRRWSVLAGGDHLAVAGGDRPAVAGEVAIELRTAAGTCRLARLGELVELDGDEPIEAVLAGGPAHLFNVLVNLRVRASSPITVGVGPRSSPVRLAFALEDTPELARWHARIDAPCVGARGIVWIA
jgi:environmental stress-induced protein Ves